MNEEKVKRLFKTTRRAAFANSRFPDKITGHDVYSTLVKFDFKCFYCNVRIVPENWQLDHFHPKANNGLNHPDNLVPCCKWCNTMKNALDGNAFIKKCVEVVEFNYFNRMKIPTQPDNFFNSAVYKKRLRKAKRYIESLNPDCLTNDIKQLYDICNIQNFDKKGAL